MSRARKPQARRRRREKSLMRWGGLQTKASAVDVSSMRVQVEVGKPVQGKPRVALSTEDASRAAPHPTAGAYNRQGQFARPLHAYTRSRAVGSGSPHARLLCQTAIMYAVSRGSR